MDVSILTQWEGPFSPGEWWEPYGWYRCVLSHEIPSLSQHRALGFSSLCLEASSLGALE